MKNIEKSITQTGFKMEIHHTFFLEKLFCMRKIFRETCWYLLVISLSVKVVKLYPWNFSIHHCWLHIRPILFCLNVSFGRLKTSGSKWFYNFWWGEITFLKQHGGRAMPPKNNTYPSCRQIVLSTRGLEHISTLLAKYHGKKHQQEDALAKRAEMQRYSKTT